MDLNSGRARAEHSANGLGLAIAVDFWLVCATHAEVMLSVRARGIVWTQRCNYSIVKKFVVKKKVSVIE